MPSLANHSEMLCYVGVIFAKHTIDKKTSILAVLAIQRFSQEGGCPNFMVVSVSQQRPARGKMRVAVIAGELIDANVRLRLTANRTYGLLFLTIVIYGDRVRLVDPRQPASPHITVPCRFD